MAKYAFTRLMRMAVTMLIVLTFVFIILRITGDPLDVLVPPSIPDETREFYRQEWGFDKPLWKQFQIYVGNVIQGDFGESLIEKRPVVEVVTERLPKTLLLGGVGFSLAIIIGVPAGMLAAFFHDRLADRVTTAVSVLGFSVPNYFLGIVFILIFAIRLGWLPASGSASWKHLILPAVTLGLAIAAQLSRFARSAMLDVLGKPYMRTAEAKGLSKPRQFIHHAFPNAGIPVVTILGFQFGLVVAGAAVIETVFGWPGIGRLLVTSITQRDFNVLQALVLMIAFAVALGNLVVDLLYGVLDPRISLTHRAKTP